MHKLICTTLLIEKSPQALPLGAACVASAVKNSPETKNQYCVELLDFCREDKDFREDEIAKYILDKEPDFVLFSIYVWNHVALENAAKTLKKINPDIITIAGGPEVTANPFVFEGMDYTVAGTGEGAVVELLSNLAKNNSDNKKRISINGVYCLNGKKETEQKLFTRTIPAIPEKLSSPYLDGTLDPSKYGGALWELARGCPFKCSYCYESRGEKKVTYFPIERLEKELELFAKKDIPQVFVLDPTYNAGKERALKMLKMIQKKTPDTFYYFEARAEFIDRELACAFTKVKCALQIGLQSADPLVLRNVNRTLDKKKFCRNIGYLNEEGVIFGFDLIYGLPGDTLKGFKNSIDFAVSLYPNNIELFCLSVLPGTDLYEKAKSFGLEWKNEPPYTVIRTPEFSEIDLKKAASLSRAVNTFYTQGRAVSWFNSLIYVLKIKPSAFFEKFEKYLMEKNIEENECFNADRIRIWQKDFVKKLLLEKKLNRLVLCVIDLIEIYGALSDADGEGKSTVIKLNYWPEDLLSEYALDINFFAAKVKPHACKIKIKPSKDGAVWE